MVPGIKYIFSICLAYAWNWLLGWFWQYNYEVNGKKNDISSKTTVFSCFRRKTGIFSSGLKRDDVHCFTRKWKCSGGGLKTSFWSFFKKCQKKPGFWSQYHKHFLTVQNTDFFPLIDKTTLIPLNFLKKPGFCDASERRVKENMAHFRSKNSPAAQNLTKPGK